MSACVVSILPLSEDTGVAGRMPEVVMYGRERLVLRHAAEAQAAAQARLLADGVAARSVELVELVAGHLP